MRVKNFITYGIWEWVPSPLPRVVPESIRGELMYSFDA